MKDEKRYSLAQLRGAYIAGREGDPSPRFGGETRGKAARPGNTQRAGEFLERELLRLAVEHGPALAYSRARPGYDYVLVPIVSLFNEDGDEAETMRIFDRVEATLIARFGDTLEVACAMEALDCRLEEALDNMRRMIAIGARPPMRPRLENR